jgi:hypothetical protein
VVEPLGVPVTEGRDHGQQDSRCTAAVQP